MNLPDNFPPLWLVYPNFQAVGNLEKLKTDLHNALYDADVQFNGIFVNSVFTDTSDLEIVTVLGFIPAGMKVGLSFVLLPLPNTILPSDQFFMNGTQQAKAWSQTYRNALKVHIYASANTVFDMLQPSSSFETINIVLNTPYDNDSNEIGYQIKGTDDDQTLADAGYTPSGYLDGFQDIIDYYETTFAHEAAIKNIRFTIFTAGHEPRVNDAGQVVTDSVDGVIADGIMNALLEAYPNDGSNGPVILPVYDVYKAGITPWPPAMEQKKLDMFGRLGLQLDTGIQTVDDMVAALKSILAMEQMPASLEIHISQFSLFKQALQQLGWI